MVVVKRWVKRDEIEWEHAGDEFSSVWSIHRDYLGGWYLAAPALGAGQGRRRSQSTIPRGWSGFDLNPLRDQIFPDLSPAHQGLRYLLVHPVLLEGVPENFRCERRWCTTALLLLSCGY